MSITGSPDAPAKVGVAMTDIVTGTLAHGAILAALYDRAAHPEKVGQRVDFSLMESQLACLSTTAAGALNSAPGTPPPGRRGTAHESIAPYQAFKCKDGEYFVIGMLIHVCLSSIHKIYTLLIAQSYFLQLLSHLRNRKRRPVPQTV